MQEIFRFIGAYQGFLYLLLLLAGLYSLRWLWKAWKEWREAYFSLEREIAMRRLAQSVAATTLILILLCGVFSVAIFVVPGLPAGMLVATPTLDLLATPSGALVTRPNQAALIGTTPVTPVTGSQGCVPGQLEITSPKPGDEISGTITLVGTVNLPNFGWYKYEVTLRGTENWISISAQSIAKKNEDLGILNTAMFTPGDYLLRVVVLDNDTQVIGTCIITIRIKGT
jgi:hypothetical protein